MYGLLIEAVNKKEDAINHEFRTSVYKELSHSKDDLMTVMKNYLSDEGIVKSQEKAFHPDYYRFKLYEESYNSTITLLDYIDFP